MSSRRCPKRSLGKASTGAALSVDGRCAGFIAVENTSAEGAVGVLADLQADSRYCYRSGIIDKHSGDGVMAI